MKKRFAIIALCALSGFNPLAAQETTHMCGSYEQLQLQLAQHPELAKQREQQEIFTQNYVAHHAMAQGKQTSVLYTIPVVVHVLYNSPTTNISDAQVLSQITVLNQDFQLLNPDAANVPAPFAAVQADCQIQFCMAKRDPQGAATNGIIRKSTTKGYFNPDANDAKFSATGGDDIWPPNQYLNVWIVPGYTTPGLIGYAQFPGSGPASTDGVVLLYTAYGNTGVVSARNNKGRVASHEIGHWLNLYHIWGDDGNACTGSDNVGDTPNQAGPNYGVPTFPHISCGNSPNGDMFMNHMDYTDDVSMLMFSQGQKARMHAVLVPGGFRASITSSQGCSAPTGGTTCSAPSGLNASGITGTGATLTWSAVASASSYSLQWKPTTGSTWNTVPAITGTSYALTGLSAGSSYSFKVSSNCGSTTSAYSTEVTFTATIGGGGCVDSYEPNESFNTATSIAPNFYYTAKIASATDWDVYRFNNSSSASMIKVSLTNVAGDYDLKLYNSYGTQVAVSENPGTNPEVLVYNTYGVGTFYAFVYGYNGASSNTQCYNLAVQTSPYVFMNSYAMTSKQPGNFTLYPNPTRGEVNVDYYSKTAVTATISIIDQSGRICKTIEWQVKEGQNKQPLNMGDLPAGFYFVKMIAGDQLITTKLLLER